MTSILAVLWAKPNGLRCVVLRYDETRYQLRLMWNDGTIKADLFNVYDEAVAAAEEWRTAADVGDVESTGVRHLKSL